LQGELFVSGAIEKNERFNENHNSGSNAHPHFHFKILVVDIYGLEHMEFIVAAVDGNAFLAYYEWPMANANFKCEFLNAKWYGKCKCECRSPDTKLKT